VVIGTTAPTASRRSASSLGVMSAFQHRHSQWGGQSGGCGLQRGVFPARDCSITLSSSNSGSKRHGWIGLVLVGAIKLGECVAERHVHGVSARGKGGGT